MRRASRPSGYAFVLLARGDRRVALTVTPFGSFANPGHHTIPADSGRRRGVLPEGRLGAGQGVEDLMARPDLPNTGRSGRVGSSCRWVRGTDHLADRSSDFWSATGPRCVSLSGLTIALMLVIWPPSMSSAITPISRCSPSRKSAPGPPLTSTGRNDSPGRRAAMRSPLLSGGEEPSCQLFALLARRLEAGTAPGDVASGAGGELARVVLALADDRRDLRVPVVEHVA